MQDTIMFSILGILWFLGFIIQNTYILLAKRKDGKWQDKSFKELRTQYVMSLVPVFNYFNIAGIFNKTWKK